MVVALLENVEKLRNLTCTLEKRHKKEKFSGILVFFYESL